MAFNARSEAHNGHGSTDKYWKLASSAMELVTNLKSDSSAAEAWAAAPAHICHTHNLSIPPRGKRNSLTNEDRDSQRKGKWTKEEEQYTNRIIELYKSGHLRLPGGLTLRSYLAEKLNCDPMRITKKFGGASSSVKEAIQQHTRLKIPSDSEIQGAKNELDFLERKFRVSIEHHGQPVLLGRAADFLMMSPPPAGPPDSQGGAGTPGIQLDPSIMSSLPLPNYHSLEDYLRDRTASFFDLAQQHGGRAGANIGTAFSSPPPTIMSPIASDDILNLATIQAAALLTPILAHQAMANNLQYHIQAAQVSQAVEQQLQQFNAALNPSQFQTPNGTKNSNSSSVVVEDPTQVSLPGVLFNKDQTTDNITSSQAVSSLGFSPSSFPSVVPQKPTKPTRKRKNKSPKSPKDQDRSKRQRTSSKSPLADKNQKGTQIPVVSPSSVRSTREDDAEMFLSFVGSLREQTSMPQGIVGTPVLHHES